MHGKPQNKTTAKSQGHILQISKLIEANIHSLRTAESILLGLSDAQYRAVLEPFTANLGKHLRHITDHYQTLFEGLSDTRIEYDRRERNENEENERSAMILRLRFLCSQLQHLQENIADDLPLSVCLAVDQHDREAPYVPSTLSRELVFLQSHSVHHYAIIAAILRLQGIQFDPDFGIAPSTLKYEHDKRCAP